METLVIQSPNTKPSAQCGEIGFFASAQFPKTYSDAATVQFIVTYPDRDGPAGSGHSDVVTVNRIGVIVGAVSLETYEAAHAN